MDGDPDASTSSSAGFSKNVLRILAKNNASRNWAELKVFLRETGFDMTAIDRREIMDGIGARASTGLSVTVHEAQAVFKHMSQQLNFSVGRIEHDGPWILQTLDAPFTDLQGAQFGAPTASQTWPIFLQMLHWMKSVVQMRNTIIKEEPELIGEQRSSSSPEVAEEADNVIAWYKYLCETYDQYLSQNTDFSGAARRLENLFETECVRVSREIDEFAEEKLQLEAKIRDASMDTEQVTQLQESVQRVKNDVAHLSEFMGKKTATLNKSQEVLAQLDKDIAAEAERLAVVGRDLENARAQVSVQEISQEDKQRLDSHMRELQQDIGAWSRRRIEAENETLRVHMQLQKRQASIAQLEERYNDTLVTLSLAASQVTRVFPRDMDMSVLKSIHKLTPLKDLRNVQWASTEPPQGAHLRSALAAAKDAYLEAKSSVEMQTQFIVQDALRPLEMEIAQLEQDLDAHSKSIQSLVEHAESNVKNLNRNLNDVRTALQERDLALEEARQFDNHPDRFRIQEHAFHEKVLEEYRNQVAAMGDSNDRDMCQVLDTFQEVFTQVDANVREVALLLESWE